MIELLIFILIVIVICGAIAFLIQRAPIDAGIKQWGVWVVIAIAVIFIVLKLAPLAGIS